MATIWLIGVALAAPPPEVRQEGDTVVVVAVAPAPPEEVRRLLLDPAQVRALFPDVLSEEIAPEPDGCVRIRRKTRGLFRPFELPARRCPTPGGYREELVASEDFDAYHSEWRVGADPAGATRIEYRVRTAIDAPVPAATVTAAARRAAVRAMDALVGRW